MTQSPAPAASAYQPGKFFREMAEFVRFNEVDTQAIRQSSLIIEKHLPAIIGDFYTNLLQYPATRKFFLKKDGTLDEAYLELRMLHQANFWRRTAGGVYDDDYARFLDYVGRAHTSRGADPTVFIAERYVIGMVGFVQHAILEVMNKELSEYDPGLSARASIAWNKLCMVILEMLARAYGHENESESIADRLPVNADAVLQMSVDSYEKGLGLLRLAGWKEVAVARVEEIPDGQRKMVEIDGITIGVFHHKGGWYAVKNFCLHRGGPVAEGRLAGDNLICPWHGFTYLLTTGQLVTDPNARLDMYPVWIIDGEVRLSLPVLKKTMDETGPAAALLGAIPDGNKTAAQIPAEPAAPESQNTFRLSELLPGSVGLVEVNGQQVAVYNVDGTYYATQDECTHAYGPLNEGELKGEEIICPWHSSCFNVKTGAATCPPAREPLKTFRVVIDGDTGRVEE